MPLTASVHGDSLTLTPRECTRGRERESEGESGRGREGGREGGRKRVSTLSVCT